VAKRGRKDKWYQLEMDEKLILVEGWARDGLTDEQIAEKLGISHNLFYKWKREKDEFREALKKGKEAVDREVENALLKAALGYEYEEETVTNKGEVVTVRKYQPPNTTAAIFWLKNRKPDMWRDKQNIEHTGANGGPIEFIAEWGEDGGSGKGQD
jgi:transposase-like protein